MGTIFDLLTGALAFAWRAISVRLFPQLKATLVKSFALRIIDLPSDAKIVDGMVQYRPGNSNSAYVNLPPNTTLNDLKEKYLLIIMEIENPDDKPNNIREYYVDFIEPTEFQYEVKLAYSIHPEKELYTHVILKHCDYTIDQYLSEKNLKLEPKTVTEPKVLCLQIDKDTQQIMGIKLELRFRDLYNSWSNLFIEFDINGDICENVISYDNNYFGVRYYYEQIRGKGNEYYGKIKSKASDYI